MYFSISRFKIIEYLNSCCIYKCFDSYILGCQRGGLSECKNGGICNPRSGVCICKTGFSGDKCLQADIRTFKINYGELKRTLTDHTGGVNALTILSNGDLVSGSDDHTIIIWNSNNGTFKRRFSFLLFSSLIHSLNSSPKNPSPEIPAQKSRSNDPRIFALAKLSNGDLVSGLHDKTIKICNPNNGTINKILHHDDSVHALITLSNGDLISGSADKTIKIWDTNKGTLKRTLTGHTSVVRALATLTNGDLVSGSFDKTIKIWDPNNWNLKKTLTDHTSGVNALTILSNGDLVTGSCDKTIKIWDPNNWTVKKELTGHTGPILALTTLSNGDLVSGSCACDNKFNNSTIKIWNPDNWTLIKELDHNGAVVALTTLLNGDLISGSTDKTIKIWNTGFD